jgi:hypothetical protein
MGSQVELRGMIMLCIERRRGESVVIGSKRVDVVAFTRDRVVIDVDTGQEATMRVVVGDGAEIWPDGKTCVRVYRLRSRSCSLAIEADQSVPIRRVA